MDLYILPSVSPCQVPSPSGEFVAVSPYCNPHQYLGISNIGHPEPGQKQGTQSSSQSSTKLSSLPMPQKVQFPAMIYNITLQEARGQSRQMSGIIDIIDITFLTLFFHLVEIQGVPKKMSLSEMLRGRIFLNTPSFSMDKMRRI